MNPTDHIALIRKKKELLPKYGAEFAQRIFEDVFQGDHLADAIEDLVADLFGIENFDDPDEHIATDEDITEMVWLNILNQLHALVHNNLTNPPRDPIHIEDHYNGDNAHLRHPSSAAFTPIQ